MLVWLLLFKILFCSDTREREEDSQAPPDLEPVVVQQQPNFGDMGQFGDQAYEPSADELIDVLKNLENLAAANPGLYRTIVEQIKGKITNSTHVLKGCLSKALVFETPNSYDRSDRCTLDLKVTSYLLICFNAKLQLIIRIAAPRSFLYPRSQVT